MVGKAKITFVVPEVLQNELREQIIKDGYGLRGKSKWIIEAIETLLLTSQYPELVNYNDEMKGFEKAEAIVVPHSLKSLLDQAILNVRTSFPLLEGVQSRIVRTAIVQRLIRS